MDNSHNLVIEHQEALNTEMLKQETVLVSMLKPEFGMDGDQYYFLYGKDLQEGIAGFGKSAYLAMIDFNKHFHKAHQTLNGKGKEE